MTVPAAPPSVEPFDAVDVIAAKRDGAALTDAQIDWVVEAYTRGAVAEEQMSALAMAIYLRGMSRAEIARWTDAMIASGERMDFSGLPRPTADKHSTGGVGDKITLPLAPLVAVFGVSVPQLSGRGLGHTGGTLDKLESIPGWRAELTGEEIATMLGADGPGAVICAAGAGLAPADKRLYALRDTTATVSCVPLIASSIMSKKIAEGTGALVLDVKVGSGAFMKEIDQARELASTMVALGTDAGVTTRALLTDMSTPLGLTAGNALEVAESLEVLAGGGPADVVDLTVALALEMCAAAGRPVEEDQARAALAEQDWTGLERILRAMDPALRQSPTWTYWHGRAQDALGHHKQARHIFQSLATRHDYYGKLAREELALPPAALPAPKAPPASLVKAMDDNDGIRQAMAFYALGLRGEGNREWNFQMRGRNEQELRAAATWAARHGLLDRAINTDERILTGQADYSLRFPTPFAEQLLTITSQQAVDPAWVYGLIRQESRFVMQARSHVGASGLMQIMPDTARWVARQMGNTTYQAGQIDDLTTNLTFGSYYLKRALDDLSGSPVLATAGYNAGPRRAHTWRASLSRPLEGAIFTELIPFTETRHYVKAVLSNTVDYATLFSGQPQSLKSWLATITPQPLGVAQLP